MPIQDILKREFIESDFVSRSNRLAFMAQRSFIQTLQPLQKGNSLYVKSFINPLLTGLVFLKVDLEPYLPCFIVKRNQLLISLSSIDFSFIMEETSARFCLVSSIQNKSKLNQNSAISFSVCVEDKFDNFKALNAILSKIQSRI
jgi:aspartate kinase